MIQVKRSFQIAVISLFLVLAGFWGGVLLMSVPSAAAEDGSPYNGMQFGSELIAETERVFSEIYNRAAPGVVSITVAEQTSSSGFFDASSGSGFIYDTQGHIVTNFHVVDGADRIEVRMYDGTITRGAIVGLDPDSDLAVVKINVPADRLRPIPVANSNLLTIGQTVLAIGSPFSNDWTLTSGIISALDRSIVGLNNYSIGGVIQTDAAINPGNSGGPLLNLNGEVIGVNSQIESGLRQNAGVGFAVPSNLIQRVVTQLIAGGKVRYSYIGISSRPIDLDLIEQFGLPNNLRGVAVLQARSDGPAAIAGIRTISNSSVDVITAIDGNPMRDFDSMIGYLAINTEPGQTINLTVYRDGQFINMPVTLAERPT